MPDENVGLIDDSTLKQFQGLSEKHCPTIYDEISCYQPKEIPERPKEINQFYTNSPAVRAKISNDIFNKIDVVNYLNEKWKAELHNRDCFVRIYQIFTGPGDPKLMAALTAKLTQFKKAILSYKSPCDVLRIDFKKYPFVDKQESVEWEE